MYMCTYVCMYVYNMYICMYVRMYVCILALKQIVILLFEYFGLQIFQIFFSLEKVVNPNIRLSSNVCACVRV